MTKAIGIDLDTKRVTFAYTNRYARNFVDWQFHEIAPDEGAALMRVVLTNAMDCGVTLAVIEKPYLGPSPKTFGLLSEVYGKIQGACQDVGLEWFGVPATVWQTAMLSQGKGGLRGVKRKERKELSMFRAREVEKADVENDHQADAVCICVWAEANSKYGELA